MSVQKGMVSVPLFFTYQIITEAVLTTWRAESQPYRCLFQRASLLSLVTDSGCHGFARGFSTILNKLR